MSRCFPFPPPGYENTARSDNVDLPSKEKHKEKKHKKEKKDKETKKDKDRSKDKHKDKKDRKEKHRDKKDKDKNKDKDTTRTSDDTRTGERAEDPHHAVKLGESSRGPQVGRDSKFTDELGRRTRDEEKGATNSMGENSGGSVQRRTKGIGITPGIENQSFAGTEVVPNSANILEKNDNELDQLVEKIAISAQRIEGIASATPMENEKGTSDSMVANFTSTVNKRNHGMRFTVDKPVGLMQERSQGRTVDKPLGLMQERSQGRTVATVDKPLGLMQERSQGRTVAAVQKEPGVTKISKAACTLLPNSIGTEHKTNHIVATNFTSDDRRNHGMVGMGDKPIGSMQDRFQGGSSAQKELSGVKNSNTIGTKVANSTGMEQRTNYNMGRVVDSTFPARAEGIHTASVLEKERGKNNNVLAAPAPDKERGRSNNAVAYLFDPIDGRNDGIGDPADSHISSFQSPADKGRVGGGQLVANLFPSEQRRSDGMGSNKEGKKKRDRDGDSSKGERHRDRDKHEKKSKKDKDKDRHKEKKREKERKKEKGENKHKGGDKPRDDRKMDMLVSPIIKPLASHKDYQKMDVLVSPVIKPLAAHKDDRKIDLLASPVIKPLASHKDVNIHKEELKSRDTGKRDMLISHGTKPLATHVDGAKGSLAAKPLATHVDGAKGSLADGNNNKRKEIKMNGIPHENVARASKIMRTSLPSHLPLENGGKLEPNSIVGPSLSHGAMNTQTPRVSDNKGPKFNGTKESRPASLDLQSPATADTNGNVTRLKPPQASLESSGNVTRPKSAQAETSGNVTSSRPPQVNAETSGKTTRSKTPHPDSKYLHQIYSVPKMEEWPEFDDQEWLFSRGDRRPKPKEVTEIEDTQQVWAEAVHIQSGDAIALPYVIPF